MVGLIHGTVTAMVTDAFIMPNKIHGTPLNLYQRERHLTTKEKVKAEIKKRKENAGIILPFIMVLYLKDVSSVRVTTPMTSSPRTNVSKTLLEDGNSMLVSISS